MDKQEGTWFLFGIIIGMIIIGAIVYSVTKDKDCIPISKDGTTFIIPDVKHCKDTYNQQCWIEKEEVKEFKKSEDWIIMVDFPNTKIVYRQ